MSNVNRLEGTIKAGEGNLSQARRATTRGRADEDDKGRQGQTHEESESVPGAEVKTQSECKKLTSVLFALFKGL